MSSTAVRIPSSHSPHVPSPAYVPRTLSRPSSPALPPIPHPSTHQYQHQYQSHRSSSTSRLDSTHAHAQRHASPLPPAGVLTPRMYAASGSGPASGSGSGSGLRHEIKENERAGRGANIGTRRPQGKEAPGASGSISDLEDEGREEGEVEEGEVTSVPEEVVERAKDMLHLLANLPAPLPSTLPPNFLPTPDPTPSPPGTFAEFAHQSRSHSHSPPTSSSTSLKKRKRSPVGLGLGLGLDLDNADANAQISPERSSKKSKHESSGYGGSMLKSPELARSRSHNATVGRSTPVPTPPSPPSGLARRSSCGKSGLRNELASASASAGSGGSGTGDIGRERWGKEKWREVHAYYMTRATLLKRHGDAYNRSPTAHSQYTAKLPHDPLKGLLCLTDSVLLYLYAFWCEEQAIGRVRTTPYVGSEPLRDMVRKGWEGEMRRDAEKSAGAGSGEEERKERARGMVGLMYLVEAIVSSHISTSQLHHLSRRSRELATVTTPTSATFSASAMQPNSSTHPHGPSPQSSNEASPPGQTGPSPHGSHNSHQSHHSHHSAISNTGSAQAEYHLPPDLLPLINQSTTSTTRAITHLLTSRHHLSLRHLRIHFPRTYDNAINSELSDEALPAPGDNLGSARKIDPDEPARFGWPIELGMCAGVAHVVAFGRGLVEECAEGEGREWVRVLE